MPKVCAHRGASGYCPENTMLAFKKAIEMKSDSIEIDVQMTKDGVVVICHDESINRTTNGSGLIKDLTYEEILKFDAGQGEIIPTLEAFLALCAENNTGANIELKNSVIYYEHLENAVAELLRKYDMIENSIISSFNHKSLVLMKSILSEVKTGLLYNHVMYQPEKYAVMCEADAIHPHFATIEKSDVENCHKSGIEVNVWTVNSEKDMKAVSEMGVDNIITNFPDICKKYI